MNQPRRPVPIIIPADEEHTSIRRVVVGDISTVEPVVNSLSDTGYKTHSATPNAD